MRGRVTADGCYLCVEQLLASKQTRIQEFRIGLQKRCRLHLT
jgi:hypothetical protein